MRDQVSIYRLQGGGVLIVPKDAPFAVLDDTKPVPVPSNVADVVEDRKAFWDTVTRAADGVAAEWESIVTERPDAA